jgi:hypothetical protein
VQTQGPTQLVTTQTEHDAAIAVQADPTTRKMPTQLPQEGAQSFCLGRGQPIPRDHLPERVMDRTGIGEPTHENKE